MNILLTGVAGFIGSHLAERLVELDHSVVGLDNFDPFYERSVKEGNLTALRTTKNFQLIEGDIRNAKHVDDVMAAESFDVIIHMAAKAGVRSSIQDPQAYQDVNCNGTMVMLEAARKHQVKKFVFASSSSIYGNNEKVPFCETDNVDYPISPYAATKKAGELLCHAYHHLFGIQINCLRFFTVYGPRQRPDLAIHKFARLIEAGQPIPVYGDGSMARDFTYIDDILDGVLAALNHWVGYRIYNLGESRPYRLDHWIQELETALGKKAIIDRQPVPPGDVRQTFADITRAKTELGYNPQTDLPQGLKTFVQWLRNQIS